MWVSQSISNFYYEKPFSLMKKNVRTGQVYSIIEKLTLAQIRFFTAIDCNFQWPKIYCNYNCICYFRIVQCFMLWAITSKRVHFRVTDGHTFGKNFFTVFIVKRKKIDLFFFLQCPPLIWSRYLCSWFAMHYIQFFILEN